MVLETTIRVLHAFGIPCGEDPVTAIKMVKAHYITCEERLREVNLVSLVLRQVSGNLNVSHSCFNGSLQR